MTTKPWQEVAKEDKKEALWWATLFCDALRECEDVPSARLAADLAFAMGPVPELEESVPVEKPVDVSLSHDIFNKRAQGILNRAIKETKRLAATTRRDLLDALKSDDPVVAAQKIIDIIARHRTALAGLLGATNLAAVLEGAQEIARKVPAVPIPGTALPLPPTLTHEQSLALIERLKAMPATEQAAHIVSLPGEQQSYIRALLAQRAAEPPIPPPPFTVRQPPAGSPEHVQYPIIENAVEELRSKRLVDRPAFDRLDAAARQKAFTVAGVDAQETLGKIRDALAENVRTGVDYREFREKILDEVSPNTFLSEGHMENVFRTNIQGGFSDGQMKVLNHPFIRSGFPYVAYDAIHDDRVRENHLALESLGIEKTNTYRVDDPVFQLFRPPWDYMDRCSWTVMTIQAAAERGIEEAMRWLASGIEPSPPAYVAMPPFQPPPGFRRAMDNAPLSIRLSMMLSIEDQKPIEEATADILMTGGGSADGSPALGAVEPGHAAPTVKRRNGKTRRQRKAIKSKRRKRT